MSNGYSGEKLIDLAESIIKTDNADLKLDLLTEALFTLKLQFPDYK